MIIFGLLLYVFGILFITGTYTIFVYAILSVWNSPNHDTDLMMMVVPGTLLLLFLILAATFIKKLIKKEYWRKTYTISMIFYIIALASIYLHVPEPVKQIVGFANLFFVLAAIFLLISFKRKAKKDSL